MLHHDPRYPAAMAHKPRFVPNLLHRRGRQRAALILAAITVVAPAHVLGEPVSVGIPKASCMVFSLFGQWTAPFSQTAI